MAGEGKQYYDGDRAVAWKIPGDVDLIRFLDERCMNHVSEKIFSSLDCKSLISAASASAIWNQIISDANMWQKLHDRNCVQLSDWKRMSSVIQLSPPWCILEEKAKNRKAYSQELCKKTDTWLRRLEKIWKFGRPHMGYGSNPMPAERYQKNPSFEITDKWIVKSRPDGKIEIWDRWTKQRHHVLPFSLGDSEDADYQHSEFMEAECVQMNNQLIVAGFVFGHVCVWGMESKKLLHIFLDNPLVAGQVPEDNGLAAEFVRLSQDGDHLVTCLISCDQDYSLLTVRRIISPCEIHLVAHVLLEPGRLVTEVFIEGSRVIVGCLAEDADEDSSVFEVQIRNVGDLSLVKTIVLPLQEEGQYHHPHMDCRNGTIAVALNESFGFWDVQSGNCLRLFPLGEFDRNIRSIRFIADKYLVSCHSDGQLNVWDVKAALETEADADNIFVRSFQLKIFHSHGSRHMLMRGDEFQLAVEVQVGIYIHRCTLDCVKRATFTLDFINGVTPESDDESESEADDDDDI